MEPRDSKQRILRRWKDTYKKWLLLSVAALVLVVILHLITDNRYGVCTAVVNFSYDGVESGLNPDGNDFDRSEIKNETVVRKAAKLLSKEELSQEDVERIQDALTIEGTVSDEIFENLTTAQSLFGKDGVSGTTSIQESSYFPSQYSITFRYADAGFSRKQGLIYLNQLLSSYEAYFYEKYGYNDSLAEALQSIDYSDYDYIDAVDLIDSRLSALRIYLARLSNQDNLRFVSQTTGYSFSDLVSVVDTLRSEDVQWLTSYITSNNMTKNRQELIDYYQYKIKDANRILTQRDARLYTLNDLIANYVKTSAIFPAMGDASAEQGTQGGVTYEFSQPSPMYDSLINEKVSCQTSMSETQEQIALFERRVERLINEESSGRPELLEERFLSIEKKIDTLLDDTKQTADEFFKTVWLKRAFQVLKEAKTSSFLSFSILKASAFDVVMAEAFIFGAYALYVLYSSHPMRKSKAASLTKQTTVASVS